jgi:hypothetical protein
MLSSVVVRSSDPQKAGAVGIACYENPGNGMLRDVYVDGLDQGVAVNSGMHGMYFENIIVENQRVAGFVNSDNTVAVRKLVARNCPSGVQNGGFMAILDSELIGPGGGNAIQSSGPLFARNLKTSGYALAIKINGRSGAQSVPGPTVQEFTSQAPRSLLAGATRSLNLPVEDLPIRPLDPPALWANVQDFGAKGDGKTDDTAAIRKAFDSDKTVVYFPAALYIITDTIRVRGNVKRVLGPTYIKGQGFKDADRRTEDFKEVIVFPGIRRPLFRLEDGVSDVVSFERLFGMYGDNSIGFEQATKRTLVLQSCYLGNYQNTVRGGKAFLDDFGGEIHMDHNQVWAWDLNTESYVGTHNTNKGGDLWILGLKTEKDRTIIATSDSGRTELFGGFIFKNRERVGQAPMFVIENASAMLNYNTRGLPYRVQVRVTQNGQTKELSVQQTGGNCVMFSDGPAAH